MAARTWTAVLPLLALAAPAGGADWERLAEPRVVEILTRDEGGEPRETKVWIVVVDGRGVVRTNDSRWLANIRRGSPLALRSGGEELTVTATESADPELAARAEAAFKEKYGFTQRLMSFFRVSEPTLLVLEAAGAD